MGRIVPENLKPSQNMEICNIILSSVLWIVEIVPVFDINANHGGACAFLEHLRP